MKRKRSDFTKDKIFEPPKYVFESGFRRVLPYYFEYSTFAKERWYGRRILDVFSADFKDKPKHYYENAIKNALISINDEPTFCDYKIRPNDTLCHLIHRHEPPVLDEKLEVIHENSHVIIINKPPSIPVHPSGRYNHNTVVGILKAERGIDHLSVINRLDRLTSGIVILAKNNIAATHLHQQMESGKMAKEYICKVKGNFPVSITLCEAPIRTANHKLSLNIVSQDGKKCQTKFEKLAFDGEFSYIKAMPITGRTHQIRVHLQHLGFPITNDGLYNNDEIWDDESKELSEESLQKVVQYFSVKMDDEYKGSEEMIGSPETCLDCYKPKPDPSKDELYLCLHAYRYTGPDFVYETSIPDWASCVASQLLNKQAH